MEAYRTYTKPKSVFVNLTGSRMEWGPQDDR
jgi:hypothetical protein